MNERTWHFSTLQEARVVQEEVEELARMHAVEAGAPFEYITNLVFWIKLTLEEVLVNHIKHGHGMDESLVAEISAHVEDGHLVFESHDKGDGFNPEEVPDPTLPENLERPCGRGVHLIRTTIASFRGSYEYLGIGNRLKIRFPLMPIEPPVPDEIPAA